MDEDKGKNPPAPPDEPPKPLEPPAPLTEGEPPPPEQPPAFDWSAVPWDQLPEADAEQLLRHPKVDARVNSVAAARAAGTLKAEREKQAADQRARAAQAAEDARLARLQALHKTMTDEQYNTFAPEVAQFVTDELTATEAARRQRDQAAHADEFRRRGYAEATAYQLDDARRAAPLRIQERMDALKLPRAEQDAIWDVVEQRPLASLSDVASAIEEAHALAYERYTARELAQRARPAAEQAARSARAAVHGSTDVDPSAGGPGPTASAVFLKQAAQASPEDFDKFWQAHKRGKLAV